MYLSILGERGPRSRTGGYNGMPSLNNKKSSENNCVNWRMSEYKLISKVVRMKLVFTDCRSLCLKIAIASITTQTADVKNKSVTGECQGIVCLWFIFWCSLQSSAVGFFLLYNSVVKRNLT